MIFSTVREMNQTRKQLEVEISDNCQIADRQIESIEIGERSFKTEVSKISERELKWIEDRSIEIEALASISRG